MDENDSASCPVVGFGVNVLNCRVCYQHRISLYTWGVISLSCMVITNSAEE